MADPTNNTPHSPAQDREPESREPDAGSAKSLREGVQQQRRHIKDVTGHDPILSGRDD